MTKLTTEELVSIRARDADHDQWMGTEDREALISHIDTLTAELSQAQAELAALRAGGPEGSDVPRLNRCMTKEQFRSLGPGDVVQHLDSGDVCSVLRKRGDVGYEVTGRRGISIPSRWSLISKAAAPQPPAQANGEPS